MKNLILQIFSYTSSNLINQISALICIILLMQNLNTENFGIYAYVTEFVGMFIFFADGGLMMYLVKEFSKEKDYLEKYRVSQSLQYIISVGIFILIILSSYLVNNTKYIDYILLFSAGAVFMTIFNPIFGLWIGRSETKLLVFKDLFMGIFKLIYTILGITFSFAIIYFLTNTLITGIIWFLIIIYLNKKFSEYYLYQSNNTKEIKKVFIESLPFLVILVTNVIYNKVDIIMIEKILGIEAVSFYSAAAKFIYPFGFISTAFMNSIFPRMIKSSKIAKSIRNIFLFSIISLASIGIILVLSLIYIAPIFYEYFFGNKYTNSISIYTILVFILPITFMLCTVNSYLIANNKLKLIIIINFISIFINITLNLIYIPSHGLEAAAYSTLFCEAFVLLFSLIITIKMMCKKI